MTANELIPALFENVFEEIFEKIEDLIQEDLIGEKALAALLEKEEAARVIEVEVIDKKKVDVEIKKNKLDIQVIEEKDIEVEIERPKPRLNAEIIVAGRNNLARFGPDIDAERIRFQVAPAEDAKTFRFGENPFKTQVVKPAKNWNGDDKVVAYVLDRFVDEDLKVLFSVRSAGLVKTEIKAKDEEEAIFKVKEMLDIAARIKLANKKRVEVVNELIATARYYLFAKEIKTDKKCKKHRFEVFGFYVVKAKKAEVIVEADCVDIMYPYLDLNIPAEFEVKPLYLAFAAEEARYY